MVPFQKSVLVIPFRLSSGMAGSGRGHSAVVLFLLMAVFFSCLMSPRLAGADVISEKNTPLDAVTTQKNHMSDAPGPDEHINPFDDEAAFMAAVETNPTDENVGKLARLRAAKARDLLSYAEENQDSAAFDLAVIYAESACDLEPDTTAFKLLAGTLYFRARHLPMAFALAEASLLQVLEKEPENRDALILLSELYYREGLFGDAVDVFEKLFLSDFKISGRAVTMLVNSYAASEETARGRRFIARCTAQKGSHASLNLAGALLAKHENDTGSAMDYLNTVIKDTSTDKRYQLYALQLKIIWSKEAE